MNMVYCCHNGILLGVYWFNLIWDIRKILQGTHRMACDMGGWCHLSQGGHIQSLSDQREGYPHGQSHRLGGERSPEVAMVLLTPWPALTGGHQWSCLPPLPIA